MDFQTIIIIVAVVLLLAYLFNRLQSRGNQMGSERPRYNDPNVQGQGSFGSDNDNQSNRNYQSRTNNPSDRYPTPGQSQSGSDNSFNRPNNNPGQRQSSSRRDTPNVQGQGSFGRDKD
jgi:hypothetical protein